MIVDVHTHTPRHKKEVPADQARANTMWRPDQTRPTTHTWDDHVQAMEPVDKAIAFNIAVQPGANPSSDLPSQVPDVNDNTAEFVRTYPDKFIGFLSVHPYEAGALDEIERGTQDLGLQGIKLGPNYQNFDPVGDEAFAVYRRAEDLGLPILFHQGTSPDRFADLDYAHPRHMDRVATAFPDLKVIMAHMGHPWQIDCITVIRKHPNVYADISAQFYRPWSYYNAFCLATEWSVLHKLLFGSDYPVASPAETRDALDRVNDVTEGTKLPIVPLDEMEKILHRDSLDLLGIG